MPPKYFFAVRYCSTEEPSSGLSATFSHPSDGRRQNLVGLSPSPVALGPWEKVADRPDEGLLTKSFKTKTL